MGGLMAVTLIESPRTYKLVVPCLMEYVGYVVNILETFAEYSPSIAESLHSLKGKVRGIEARRQEHQFG
jgi:hypothetical protein